MSTISSPRSIENKHDVNRGKDCKNRFYQLFSEYAMKIVNSRNLMKIQKSVTFVKNILKINIRKIKNIITLEIIVIIQGNIEVLCIAYLI